jgi:predicted MPP superfamily phosphohydrolase
MIFLKNHLAAEFLVTFALAVHYGWWRGQNFLTGKRWGRVLLLALTCLVCLAFVLEAQRVNRLLPLRLVSVLHTTGLAWSLASLAIFGAQTADAALVRIVDLLSGGKSKPGRTGEADLASPGRRRLLQAVRGAIYATPAIALGYGTFIERNNFRVEEITIPLAGLPKELEGLRIVQITDIHMGGFLSEREMKRITGMANDTRANLAIMTGDLITRVGDPVDVCLKYLAQVKTDAGMIGCLGNHEIYALAEDYVEKEGAKLGIQFLRSRNRVMEFGGQKLNFAGVDYQRRGSQYLEGANRLIEPYMTNILLSHNPDVFPVAASQGYALTLSGHTHGGQITVEYLQQFVNPARFVTRYVSGLYSERGKHVYVSRGLGTVGVPTRLCAPPELTVIRLASVYDSLKEHPTVTAV